VSSDAAEVGQQPGIPEEFVRLQGAVRRLLDEVAGYRARAKVAEERAAELERAMRDLSSGALDPMKMRQGLRSLEQENTELRRRMVEAHDRIRRLIARFDFLSEEME
jgi:uncharacterized phage protein gp47/JayE